MSKIVTSNWILRLQSSGDAFTCKIPKTQSQSSRQCLFAILGSACKKAAQWWNWHLVFFCNCLKIVTSKLNLMSHSNKAWPISDPTMCHLVTLAQTPPPHCDVTFLIFHKSKLFGLLVSKNISIWGQKMSLDSTGTANSSSDPTAAGSNPEINNQCL